MKLDVVILAAGEGKRMRHPLPKVLHRLGGCSLLERVYQTAKKITSGNIYIVHSKQNEQLLKEHAAHWKVKWVLQKKQNGTGDAVKSVLPYVGIDRYLLILSGDVACIKGALLKRLHAKVAQAPIALLTCEHPQPKGYGRIVRNTKHRVEKIVEHRDANTEELAIKEIYSGIMIVQAALLQEHLPKLKTKNSQKEFYLTDLVNMVSAQGDTIACLKTTDTNAISGVNCLQDLSALERNYQKEQASKLLAQGVVLRNAEQLEIRGNLRVGVGCCFDSHIIFEGNNRIGNGVTIGANSILINCVIEDNTTIHPNTIIEDSKIGKACSIGPFARIRPKNILGDKVKVGNFVEIKASRIGDGSKISHLSYIGDAILEQEVNIGAGTITCNYDGKNKHRTHIQSGAFIGSNCELVAPVKIGAKATIGAGTTVTKNIPTKALATSRVQELIRPTWNPVKKRTRNRRKIK